LERNNLKDKINPFLLKMLIFEHRLPENKRLEVSLKSCLGFGLTSSNLLSSKLGLNLKGNKINKLNKKLFNKLERIVNSRATKLLKLCIGTDRNNKVLFETKKMRETHTFRSLRHHQRLPVRGQRTKTNARTQKSKRGFRRNLPVPGKKKV
jgi:small subunit ribosomal protein S13